MELIYDEQLKALKKIYEEHNRKLKRLILTTRVMLIVLLMAVFANLVSAIRGCK